MSSTRQRERSVTVNTTHGASGTPVYQCWGAMIQRYTNPNHPSFSSYGGRGVTVCDEWRRSFEAFRDNMGAKPTSRHTLDRIDNDGPYSPENCRWATSREQNLNKRDNRLIEHDGARLNAAGWAKRLGVSERLIGKRIDRGWSAEKAVSTPVQCKKASAS